MFVRLISNIHFERKTWFFLFDLLLLRIYIKIIVKNI